MWKSFVLQQLVMVENSVVGTEPDNGVYEEKMRLPEVDHPRLRIYFDLKKQCDWKDHSIHFSF